MTDSDTVSVLNSLIETSKNGEKGFATAAEDVKSAELKQFFSQYSTECAAAARELQDEVRARGGDPETGGSALGALHRGWVDMKGAITGHDDVAIINECERGEDVAKSDYSKALEKDLPISVRTLVQRHYEGVVRHHDHVRALREQYKAMKS